MHQLLALVSSHHEWARLGINICQSKGMSSGHCPLRCSIKNEMRIGDERREALRWSCKGLRELAEESGVDQDLYVKTIGV